ncbi:MAG: ISKra4 family transposase [Marmoricola sp.]
MSNADAERGAGFTATRSLFESLLAWLDGTQAATLSHAALEDRLRVDARELIRQALQEHLDQRAESEPDLASVIDAQNVPRPTTESGHSRALATVFGPVQVTRKAYRKRGRPNLHPADAALNLPEEKHSHGLRRLAAIESARGSFDAAVEAIERGTGQRLGKRQVEDLASSAAVDFDAYYRQRQAPTAPTADVLVISCDGKGVVMRPGSLRTATAKAAAHANPKLLTRLSKGEKRGRKRMAEVGAVYDLTPVSRCPADILRVPDTQRPPATAGPTARHKWLTASILDDAATVVTAIFDEADRRDPAHQRTWVALVDGNVHQIQRIQAEATNRHVTVSIVIDFVHVLEYLWKAAWSFHREGDPAAEAWVRKHAHTILEGHATRVAGTIRRAATLAGLDKHARENADKAATYLTNKKAYLDYPTALNKGWPIATGIIEGACRHLVKDRMDLTGARWGLHGAEAILKLRALYSNGDFETYWAWHLTQEHRRVHQDHYLNGALPRAA